MKLDRYSFELDSASGRLNIGDLVICPNENIAEFRLNVFPKWYFVKMWDPKDSTVIDDRKKIFKLLSGENADLSGKVTPWLYMRLWFKNTVIDGIDIILCDHSDDGVVRSMSRETYERVLNKYARGINCNSWGKVFIWQNVHTLEYAIHIEYDNLNEF